MSFDPAACAAVLVAAHENRQRFGPLPEDIAPRTIEEAYAAQAALIARLAPVKGAIGGWKIATTTKVMQRLVGIDHPCSGAVFASTIQPSGATIALSRHVSLKAEAEIALVLGASLPPRTDLTAKDLRPAVASVAVAFELVEDRSSDYTKLKAFDLIADNCWNAGIVLGAAQAVSGPLGGRRGVYRDDGVATSEGVSEDPFVAAAWLANALGRRGIGLEAGQVLMTGSVVPTQPLVAGHEISFTLEGVGAVSARMAA
jgi:2-keto-4-pentenoate hydratase